MWFEGKEGEGRGDNRSPRSLSASPHPNPAGPCSAPHLNPVFPHIGIGIWLRCPTPVPPRRSDGRHRHPMGVVVVPPLLLVVLVVVMVVVTTGHPPPA